MSAEVESVMSENFQDGENEQVNGNVLFSKDSAQNMPTKDGRDSRVFKKAKRTMRLKSKSESSGDGGPTSPLGAPFNGAPFSKNSRKSHSALGRGLPKKGGAGGKGTWGKLGSELLIETEDANDPNYDSDSQDAVKLEKVTPVLKEGELYDALKPILKEYLEHGDSAEVKTLLAELNVGDNKSKIAELAVSLALDRHDPHRELTSRLISDLHGPVLTRADLSTGFNELLNNIQDLTLDTPDAPTVLGQFIARAVADDCLTIEFITSYKGHVESSLVQNAMEKAEVLLQMGSFMQLDQVWGEGGGNRPVKSLTNKIVLLLREYLDSCDGMEAMRCLRELDVPHFHHEVVYQAAVIAIEKSSDTAAASMTAVLKTLTATNLITPDQFKKGVMRVFEDMPDISVDVPSAYALLERLGNKMYAEGVLNDDLMKEMPTRGRKRFVSEGDGGKVKEQLLR